MSVNYIDIPGRLRSVALDGQVAGANQVYDDNENMFQSVINELMNAHMNDASIHFNPDEKQNIDNIGKLISIVGLSAFTCSSEKITNPEWEYAILDASSHILAGIRRDSEIVINADLDEILTYVTPPNYGLIDVNDGLMDVSSGLSNVRLSIYDVSSGLMDVSTGLYSHINDSSIHLSEDDILKLSYICTFSTLNGSFEQNPEWKQVILDASNHILAGVNNDNKAYLYASIDEIFNIIEAPKYSIVDHVEDSSIHITQEERDAWNLQADWNETDASSLAYIQHKPSSLPASDVSAWAKQPTKPSYTNTEVGLGNVTNDAQVKRSEMGAASGVATLGDDGKVPASQLPVDDNIGLILAVSSIVEGSGDVSVITNPEYKWVVLDASSHILMGSKTDGSFYSVGIDVLTSYSGNKSGTFADRPTYPYVGQQYFCIDKQTTEGVTDGIPIWYNGSGWVDALGRTVS